MSHDKRVNIINGTYLIFIESNGKSGIFSDEDARQKYEQTVRIYETKYSFKTLSFRYSAAAVMSVINISDIPTSKIMQGVLTSFSKYLNSHTGMSGKKLKDRYRAYPIKKEYIEDVLSLTVEDLNKYGIPKRYIQKKGAVIDYMTHKKRVSSFETGFAKALRELQIDAGIKEARYAHIILLSRYTALTNRQIASEHDISESAVSKIISKGIISETGKMILEKYIQMQ
jgi:hypothetical protein